MTQLSICLDQLHGLRWKLSLSKVTSHPPGYACKGTICLCTFHCHKWYLSVLPPWLGTAQLIIYILWRQGWAPQGFTVLRDYCPISADHSYCLACLGTQHSPGERFYTTGGEAALSVCYMGSGSRWGWAHSAFSSTVCHGSRQRGSWLCVSNGIPGKRCLTAGLVTREIAVLSAEYLLALQIFNLVVET